MSQDVELTYFGGWKQLNDIAAASFVTMLCNIVQTVLLGLICIKIFKP